MAEPSDGATSAEGTAVADAEDSGKDLDYYDPMQAFTASAQAKAKAATAETEVVDEGDESDEVDGDEVEGDEGAEPVEPVTETKEQIEVRLLKEQVGTLTAMLQSMQASVPQAVEAGPKVSAGLPTIPLTEEELAEITDSPAKFTDYLSRRDAALVEHVAQVIQQQTQQQIHDSMTNADHINTVVSKWKSENADFLAQYGNPFRQMVTLQQNAGQFDTNNMVQQLDAIRDTFVQQEQAFKAVHPAGKAKAQKAARPAPAVATPRTGGAVSRRVPNAPAKPKQSSITDLLGSGPAKPHWS